MNQFKNKENINPNISQHIQKDQKANLIQRTKTIKVLKQKKVNNTVNKISLEKNIDNNNVKRKEKQRTQYISPQLHYQHQISLYTMKKATQRLNQYKKMPQNTDYLKSRNILLQKTYSESIKFALNPKTYHTYISYLDTYMKYQMTLKKHQLNSQNILMINYACFLMALKYQQIYPPLIEQWLPKYIHQKVYKWQARIIYDINFKFLIQTHRSFLLYWSDYYKLPQNSLKKCSIVLDSITFNYNLLYKYQAQKLTKALIQMQIDKKNIKQDQLYPFTSNIQRTSIISAIKKHIMASHQRIEIIKMNSKYINQLYKK